jgi:hypothetical protein
MTETEKKELLKQAVLKRWEDSKRFMLNDLSEKVNKLEIELANKRFSNFDLSQSTTSIETIKEELWFAYIEAYKKKDRETGSITESEKAGHDALDKHLEKLENVNFKEDTQGEKTEKIDWEAGLAELTFIFEILFKNEEIGCSMKQYKKRWALIAKHFTVKGEDITNKDLIAAFSGLKNSKTGKPRNHEMYEDLLTLTKKEAGFFPEE